MRAAGSKFTVQLFENFQRKLLAITDGLTPTFKGLTIVMLSPKEDELGFGIRDENGDSYSNAAL